MKPFGLDDEIQVDIPKYLPSSLEKLSLFWELDEWEGIVTEFQYPFSMNHLKNLQKLELKLTLALDDFRDIIKTVSDPSKLKILRFDIANTIAIARKKDGRVYEDVEEFLRGCSNLEGLEIRIHAFPVMDFFFETANTKLKELKIHHCAFRENNDDLLELGDIIKHQKDSLENLVLSLRYKDFEASSLERLFENIKLLQNLKKFELKLLLPPSSQKIPSIAVLLAGVVEAFDCLEELDFEEDPVDLQEDSKEDFERLCQVLVRKHSKSLKSLRLSCQKHVDILMQTLKRLPRLEHLSLWNLKAEGSNFYSDLRDLVCGRNKGLNSVTILENSQKYRNEEHENFKRMLHDIIYKPTMKKLCYWEDGDTTMLRCNEAFNSFESPGFFLNLPDILREVYHFENLEIPFYICKPMFDSKHFDRYKWE